MEQERSQEKEHKETHHSDDKETAETHHSEQHAGHHKHKRSFYARGFIPLLAFVIFIILFAIIFSMHKTAGKTQYDAMNQKSLAIREFGMADAPKMMGYFTTYGILAGILFGIFTLIISYIIYGLARIAKWDGAAGLSIAVTYALFAFYGFEFAYLGPGTTTWANGITAFLGAPLLWSSIILSIIGMIFVFLTMRSGKHAGASKGEA